MTKVNSTYVEDVLAAIKSVRGRAKASIEARRFSESTLLMEDLRALELCLVIETEKLVEELERLTA